MFLECVRAQPKIGTSGLSRSETASRSIPFTTSLRPRRRRYDARVCVTSRNTTFRRRRFNRRRRRRRPTRCRSPTAPRRDTPGQNGLAQPILRQLSPTLFHSKQNIFYFYLAIVVYFIPSPRLASFNVRNFVLKFAPLYAILFFCLVPPHSPFLF